MVHWGRGCQATLHPDGDLRYVSLDPRAARGFARAAECYERGRPSYPPAAIARLVDNLGVTRRSVVLDLAAGTGKLTRLLLPHAGTVVAVEPVPDMRRELAAQLPTVTVLAGAAEAIPIGDGCVDAVVVGEAFHWFDTTEAAAEIARVLATGGGLGMLWNTPTWTDRETPWLSAFRATVAQHKCAAGAYPAGNGEWEQPLAQTRLFDAVQHSSDTHVQHLTVDDFVAQVASWSWIAGLSDTQRAAVLADVRALLRAQAEIAIPYRTDVYWTRHR